MMKMSQLRPCGGEILCGLVTVSQNLISRGLPVGRVEPCGYGAGLGEAGNVTDLFFHTYTLFTFTKVMKHSCR